MTAGSTIPLRSIERELMARLQSAWYWFIMVRIFSLVDSMVSMAFSSGDRTVCRKDAERSGNVAKKRTREVK